MTRAKITEGRTDLELEARGSIFSGRDEKMILANKKEFEKQRMKEELERQIEEKKRKKDDEKRKIREIDMQEEQRVRRELEQYRETQNYNVARQTKYSQFEVTGGVVGFHPA